MMKAIVLAALTTFTFTTTIAAAENTRKTFECPENVSIGLTTEPSKVFELYSQSLELERKNGQIILAKFGLYSGHPKEMGLLKAQKKKGGNSGVVLLGQLKTSLSRLFLWRRWSFSRNKPDRR